MKRKVQSPVAICAFLLLSIRILEFTQQVLLQKSPRSLFDRTTLGCYSLLLRLTLPARPRFHRLRHMPDLRSVGTDVSLCWFCVRIHGVSRCLVAIKIAGTATYRVITLSKEDLTVKE